MNQLVPITSPILPALVAAGGERASMRSAIQRRSFFGSRPTSVAIKLNNRSGPVPNPGTPTVLPLRPAMP